VFHDRSKHVEIKYYYIMDMMQRKEVILQYVNTKEHDVDVLTKPLSRMKFKNFIDKIGMVPLQRD
jgi:hypothetical protein